MSRIDLWPSLPTSVLMPGTWHVCRWVQCRCVYACREKDRRVYNDRTSGGRERSYGIGKSGGELGDSVKGESEWVYSRYRLNQRLLSIHARARFSQCPLLPLPQAHIWRRGHSESSPRYTTLREEWKEVEELCSRYISHTTRTEGRN